MPEYLSGEEVEAWATVLTGFHGRLSPYIGAKHDGKRHAATLRELWEIVEAVAEAGIDPNPDPRLSYEEAQLEPGTVARARRVRGLHPFNENASVETAPDSDSAPTGA